MRGNMEQKFYSSQSNSGVIVASSTGHMLPQTNYNYIDPLRNHGFVWRTKSYHLLFWYWNSRKADVMLLNHMNCSTFLLFCSLKCIFYFLTQVYITRKAGFTISLCWRTKSDHFAFMLLGQKKSKIRVSSGKQLPYLLTVKK